VSPVTTSPSPLVVAVVYPDLLGTYGDGGNGLVLARRAAWRGLPVELIEAHSDRSLPMADIYCIGGGEDGPQVRAAQSLVAEATLGRAVEQGAVVLGVCAGFQILGRTFPDAAGHPHPGLGLLDVHTGKGTGRRAVGELVAITAPTAPRTADGKALPTLTGFENHSGVTTLGPGAQVLAQVVTGTGNGGGDGTEGAWSGRVVGTYLHGPVLARNTALADLLIGWATGVGGSSAALAPLDDTEELALRRERLAAVGEPGRGRLSRLLAARRS